MEIYMKNLLLKNGMCVFSLCWGGVAAVINTHSMA